MIQEINLYRLLPKQTGMYLTREVVVISYSLFIFVLFLLIMLSFWQKKQLEKEFSLANENARTVHQQLVALTTQYPISDPAQLKLSLQELKTQIENKANIIDILALNVSFSQYLYNIASATVPGTWLKEIILNRTNNKMILLGFTLQRSMLEQFLNGLQKQPQFAGMVFTIDEFTEATKPATFKISTKSAIL